MLESSFNEADWVAVFEDEEDDDEDELYKLGCEVLVLKCLNSLLKFAYPRRCSVWAAIGALW